MKLIAQILCAAALVAPLTLTHANTAVADAPAKAAKPDLVKGEATYGAVCAACHGADGNSGTPAYPKLAQQHPEYLVLIILDEPQGTKQTFGFATAGWTAAPTAGNVIRRIAPLLNVPVTPADPIAQHAPTTMAAYEEAH